jgi:hypothetical protein
MSGTSEPAVTGLSDMDKLRRRAFLGLGAAGMAGAAAAAAKLWSDTGLTDKASGASQPATSPGRKIVLESALPGDPHWKITHLGAEHAIEGYTGQPSVPQGGSFPLFVSTTARSFTVTAYRMGWYRGDGARQVWRSGTLRGHQQAAAVRSEGTNTVSVTWDPAAEIRTDDWPPGSYLLRLDAETGAQRYVPITVRSQRTAGTLVIRNCVATWQAYNTWGGYDLYKGPGADYASRSLAVSLDRPYDMTGAAMFLTYERNIVKLAEQLGLPLSYVTSHDIAASPSLLAGASALISPGHDEYWSPPERAHVTAARDAGMNIAFLGANAMFRRTRLDGRRVICYKSSYTEDPMYGVDNTLVTSDWREAPHPAPESAVIGTIYEGYPVDASYVVTAAASWPFKNTGIHNGIGFAHLVGVEYDRVNPAYPVPRPIQVLAHSPLRCNGAASYADTAYYTHAGGAGVFNAGTMRWVEAIYGDQPHGISGSATAFVRQVTKNVLRAFADGPAAAKYPAHDNLDAMHEYAGDPVGSPGNLQ